jgi:hypothetical protein
MNLWELARELPVTHLSEELVLTSADSGRLGRVDVSFIIDSDPMFAYTGWHLAHSIATHARLPWKQIHVQFTPEVPSRTIKLFEELGCSMHQLERFGDGKYCNKLAQWHNLRDAGGDHFVFLDTDMICIDDFTRFLPTGAVGAKVVDLDNPRFPLLDHLFERAGFSDRPEIVSVEGRDRRTFRGNCNGGLYSVPASFADELFECWREFAIALLNDPEPLNAAGKASHVDQVAFCMALHHTGLLFDSVRSNANYYLHFAGPHPFRDPAAPLALLHYHNSSVGVLGLLEPSGAIERDEIEAVEKANTQIRENFQTELFWEMRYRHFPDRGSGVGSRGSNLEYKRQLLRREGAEQARSVLDVGCGDLEVVSALDFQNYSGIDSSAAALNQAAAKRPDWKFLETPATEVAPADLVLCFEVIIHQRTEDDYRELVEFLAQKTDKTLIVSGYDERTDRISSNHMLFFYEPIHETLKRTGRFRSIRRIGAHSDVVVYRCDV